MASTSISLNGRLMSSLLSSKGYISSLYNIYSFIYFTKHTNNNDNPSFMPSLKAIKAEQAERARCHCWLARERLARRGDKTLVLNEGYGVPRLIFRVYYPMQGLWKGSDKAWFVRLGFMASG